MPARDPPPRRTPKPSQHLDADARRLLAIVLGRVDIEQLAAMACQSESTIRRFADGATGARASVRMLTQAIVVAVCERASDVAASEREVLVRLARESTPGGVGLHHPLLVETPPRARESREDDASEAGGRDERRMVSVAPRVRSVPR